MKVVGTILLLLVAAMLAGCGGAGSGSAGGASAPATSGSEASSAPAAASLPADLDQGPRAAADPIDASKAAAGEKLFQTKGCSACHAFGRRVSCPDLDGVTTRRTAKWIQSQILHPEVMTKQDPIARQLYAQFSLQMPNQKLTEEEAAQVLEFLKHKNHESAAAR